MFAMDYFNRGPAMQVWQVAMPLALSLSAKLPLVGAQYGNTTNSVTTSSSTSTDKDATIAVAVSVVAGVGIIAGVVAYGFWRKRRPHAVQQTAATSTSTATGCILSCCSVLDELPVPISGSNSGFQ
jgi:hypothetical protein